MIILLWIGIGLIVLYEIWALRTESPGDTISELIWKISKKPIVPFFFGLLMGHFFW